jgi:hypothetical protein
MSNNSITISIVVGLVIIGLVIALCTMHHYHNKEEDQLRNCINDMGTMEGTVSSVEGKEYSDKMYLYVRTEKGGLVKADLPEGFVESIKIFWDKVRRENKFIELRDEAQLLKNEKAALSEKISLTLEVRELREHVEMLNNAVGDE